MFYFFVTKFYLYIYLFKQEIGWMFARDASGPAKRLCSQDYKDYSFIFIFYILFIYFFLLYSTVTKFHLEVYIIFSHITCSIISDSREFPVLHSRIPLLIHPEGITLHLFTPSSQYFPLPPLLSWQPQVYSPSPWFSFLWNASFMTYIRFQI